MGTRTHTHTHTHTHNHNHNLNHNLNLNLKKSQKKKSARTDSTRTQISAISSCHAQTATNGSWTALPVCTLIPTSSSATGLITSTAKLSTIIQTTKFDIVLLFTDQKYNPLII